MIRGIDVSHHNPNPDFAKAKASGISFVYVKATEGRTYQDPQYQPNAWNAREAGLLMGFYHFARPDNGNKPEDEAKNFLNAISVFKYDLIPVLDLEVPVSMSDEALFKWVKAFIDTVKAKTGHNVMLYTYLSYLNARPALKKLANYGVPLWLAAYRSSPPSVSGWDWTMWQYTDKEQVPGIGKCDANNLVDLNKILINPPKKEQPATPVQRVLNLGDSGEDVRLVQQKLGIKADGIFGPQTQQAVMEFQRKNGLTVDGIVGPQTWNALFPTYAFYDCVVNDEQKATFSARNIDDIAEKIKELLKKQPDKITLYKRK